MSKTAYGFARVEKVKAFPAPQLNYAPPRPRQYHLKIALVGCGGISAYHLQNYRALGLDVAMLCDVNRSRAEARAKEFFPGAQITTDCADVFRCDEIEVVDIATHPVDRASLIKSALLAKKHVLSQKPFVLDLAVGKRLADLAEKQGVRLAVNQNGRWSPHWSYLSQLVSGGLLGRLATVDFSLAWDHSWIRTTSFNTIHHLVLYDFAAHWFDIATVFMGGRRAKSVFAKVTANPHQPFTPPALASVIADYGDAQVRWVFNAVNRFDQCDRTMLCGFEGTAVSSGPGYNHQTVTLTTARGVATPQLEGDWFTSGFQGAMGELLCAIEENREPAHGARGNLVSLELAFAAIASAETGKAVKPGTVRKLSGKALARCLPARPQN